MREACPAEIRHFARQVLVDSGRQESVAPEPQGTRVGVKEEEEVGDDSFGQPKLSIQKIA